MNINSDNALLREMQQSISEMVKEYLEYRNIYCKMDVSVIQYQELGNITIKLQHQDQDKILINIHDIE